MKLSHPLKGNPPMTGKFEERETFLVNGVWTLPFHYGIDWAVPAGIPIFAAHDGVVATSGWDTTSYGGGYEVQLRDGGWSTWYMHMLKQPPLSVGARVKRGDIIGFVGSTGLSTGNHLHFELHLKGVAVDPLPYLNSVELNDIGVNEMFAAVIDGKTWYLVIPQGTGKPKAVILHGESQVSERGEFPVVFFSHKDAKAAFWRAVDKA